MKTTCLVVGYLSMAILIAFEGKEHLIPQGARVILWVGVLGSFSLLVFKQDLALPQQRSYHNSPKRPVAGKIVGSVEVSRGSCRERFEAVKAWKEDNEHKSWDHVEAVAIFGEFSRELDRHLREFSSERSYLEVQEWIRFADEIRRNGD